MASLEHHSSEMMEVVADHDLWRFNLEMMPSNFLRHERVKKKEEEFILAIVVSNTAQ